MHATAYLVAGGILIFAGASFFFALAESALFALGKWQARQLAEQAAERGALLHKVLEEHLEVLATISLGNTLANSSIFVLALWEMVHGRWPLRWALPGVLVLILVGCEVLPKTLAVRAPARWALMVARPLWWLHLATGGLLRWVDRFYQWLLQRMTARWQPQTGQLSDAEYQELLEMAYQEGTLRASEKEIILQIISLDQKTAHDVMRPLSEMAAIPDDMSIEEMIEAARRYKHRRLPIYDETPDTIVGILNAQALLLDPQSDLADVIEWPSFVPESMNLLRLLQGLSRQQRSLAIVLDEYGGTAGLVTTDDILESVVGRVHEPEGADRRVCERLGEGRWRMSGTYRLDDFRREYPALADVPEIDTMGGLLVHLLQVVPRAGDSAQFSGLKLTATRVTERRVLELEVEVLNRKAGRAEKPAPLPESR